MKSYADYVPFKTDDFLSDPDFKVWIKDPTPESHAYWRGLFRTHPHLREPFEEARILALGLESSWVEFSETYKNQLFDKMLPQLLPEEEKPVKLLSPTWSRWAVAASIIILLTAGLFGYNYYFQSKIFHTEFAEIQSVTLYDGSIVSLNANSHLEVPSRYEWSNSRIVHLEGEAYFVVSKLIENSTKKYRKFTVKTSNASVEVYGTQFNVYARNNQTKVLLDEGKVELVETQTKKQITMKPGQMVEVSINKVSTKLIETPLEQAKQLTSWKNNLLIFNEVNMEELKNRFQEVYGIELILKGEAFDNQAFKGELPVNNLDEALLILSTTFGQKPLRDGDKIYFVPKD
jgi:transmembrane sensor